MDSWLMGSMLGQLYIVLIDSSYSMSPIAKNVAYSSQSIASCSAMLNSWSCLTFGKSKSELIGVIVVRVVIKEDTKALICNERDFKRLFTHEQRSAFLVGC